MEPGRRRQPPEPCDTATPEVPALYNALKSAALGLADDVDVVAGFKHVRADGVTGIHLEGEVAEFLDATHRVDGAILPGLAVGQAVLALDGATGGA